MSGSTTTLGVIIKAGASGFRSEIRGAASDLKSFENQADATSAKGSKSASILKAAWVAMSAAVVMAVGSLFTTTAEFEQNLRDINSIAGMSESQLKATGDQLLQMSTRFTVGANNLAEGLYDVQSSGFAGADAMTVLDASATAASAGMTDTATSARTITAALNAYGKGAEDAEHVSNVLFQGVNVGVMTFEELAGSMGNVVPAAAAAGVGIEDLTAAIAASTLSGLSAAEASTSMSRLMQALIQPSDALAEAYKRMGIESGSAGLETLGLSGMIEKLSGESQGNIDVLLKWFPEIRAVRGALSLMAGEGKNYTSAQEAMKRADEGVGAAKKAMAEQMKATNGQAAILWNTIQAKLIVGMTAFLPAVKAGMAVVQNLGGDFLKLAGTVAERLAPAWADLVKAWDQIVPVARQVADAAAPIVTVFASIVGGAVIGSVLALASALEKISGYLGEHPGLVRAIGFALATYAVARTVSWGLEMAKTSTLLADMVGGSKNLGSALVSGFQTAKAGIGLVAEGFADAFSAAGGGVKGLTAGIGGAGSAMGSLGSMAPIALNPAMIAVAAVTAVVVGLALAWKDAKDAQKAAAKAADEFGDAVSARLSDAKQNAADFADVFASMTTQDTTELGKITQSDEFKKAMDEMGVTFEDLAHAMAEPGSAGEVMFAELAAKAEDFDSVMESMNGSQDLTDGLQRLQAIGTKNLADLARAGGPASDAVKDIIDAQDAAAKSAGEYATEVETLGDKTTDTSKKRLDQLKEEGRLVKVVEAASGDYAITRNKNEADATAVYERTLAAMEAQGIQLDENGQAVMALTDAQQKALDQTGVAEERFRAMTAAEQQQLAVLAELEPVADEISKKLGGMGFGAQQGFAVFRGELAAAIPLMADGQVSAADLATYADQMGISAEMAGSRISTLADLTGKAAQDISAQFPTLGAAASAVTVPVEQLDGTIQDVQMTADNFSLDKLLEEQQKLVDAQISMNDNMAQLLAEGQAGIVQQAQSLPPELRGVFLQQVMEMPADQRAKLESDFLTQQAQLADSGARLVEAGYGTIDLTTPTVQSAMAARAAAVDELGRPINAPVTASAETTAAEQAINDAARDRTATVHVSAVYQDIGPGFRGVGVDSYQQRTGGVIAYASGGVRPHVARDGQDIIRYAEKGTGGEIYVPKNTDRQRALSILSVGAGWHNAAVVPLRYGGMIGRAGPSVMSSGSSGSTWTVSLSIAPQITVAGAASAQMTGREIVDQLRGAVPELGEMLRRETAGRR